jgi:hypothetical protein
VPKRLSSQTFAPAAFSSWASSIAFAAAVFSVIVLRVAGAPNASGKTPRPTRRFAIEPVRLVSWIPAGPVAVTR